MKKTIAILLSVVMLLGCVCVAAVNAAETGVQGSVLISQGGKTYTADKDSIITYRVYIQVPEIVENGQFYINYPQNLINIDDYNVPNLPGYMINYDENLENKIKFNFSNTSGCDLKTEKLLIEVMFKVVGEGSGEINFGAEILCNLQDQPIVDKALFRESLDNADVYVPTSSDTTPTSDPSQPTQPTTETTPAVTEPGSPDPSDKSDTDSPKLSAKSKKLKAGKAFTLKVKGTSEAVTFSSNKKSVASVSKKGVVTALKKGAAKITAKLKSGKKLTCKVSVTSNPKLSPTKVKVKINKTKKVIISGKAKSVNNKYSKTKIAKVTSKTSASTIKVKGLKKGTTTLKITVNKKVLKLKVTVTK